MNRILFLSLLLVCLLWAVAASAETNGQEQSTSDVVRTSSQALTTMVQGRVATIAAPIPAGVEQSANNTIDSKGNFAYSTNVEELGLASGEEAMGIGIWAMGAYTNFKSTTSGAKYDADAYNLMVGADYRATDELLVGLAAGFGVLDLDKKDWNGGADTGSLKTDHEWTIMPYAAYNLTDFTVVDGAFAYTDSRYKDDDGTNVGRYDSERYLTNIGISQYFMYEEWTFSGRAGYMYVHGDLSSYSRGGTNVANPDSYLGQLNLEGKAAYYFENGLQPYTALRYFVDTSSSTRPTNSDYDEFGAVLGVNWYVTDQWIFNLEGSSSLDRSDFESYSGHLNVRYEF
ncbi:autotransporter outer membrane beta-barrel domain-containing protein [Pseudodesulfovibrio sediminis]|uniref:autotransporter outer membrane beta-barrel domain-containing protein n=1 Tax=Pseudodesulfovibrio sediminis TaxID=2810563 RepID=UPI001E47E7C0|nr:autotransporter outer membrane beta-barrel domain-containing protein [Pseudodesulfovibrio sediminis]